jgi:hypothetical protein
VTPRILVALAVLIADARPAAVAVDERTCGQYAGEYTLVRSDVLAKLNDADKNLPAAEAALARAQEDLRALKAAADELARQKTVLVDHVQRLDAVIRQQQQVCGVGQRTPDVVSLVWEEVDAPLSFVAGAGMCIGLAWGLNEVTR